MNKTEALLAQVTVVQMVCVNAVAELGRKRDHGQ